MEKYTKRIPQWNSITHDSCWWNPQKKIEYNYKLFNTSNWNRNSWSSLWNNSRYGKWNWKNENDFIKNERKVISYSNQNKSKQKKSKNQKQFPTFNNIKVVLLQSSLY